MSSRRKHLHSPFRRSYLRAKWKARYLFWRLRRGRPRAEKWEIAEGITGPAGELRIEQIPTDLLTSKLTATMVFRDRELQLVFEKVVHSEWWFDGRGTFSFAPSNRGLPRAAYPGDTELAYFYPLLRIAESRWDFDCAACCWPSFTDQAAATHYVLLSGHGTLEVLALPGVTATWTLRAAEPGA